MLRPTIFLMFFSALFSACFRVDSSDIKITGISADIEATTDGQGDIAVQVYLHQGEVDTLPALYLDLTGKDRLVAKVLDSERVLSRSALLGIVGYDTTFFNLGVPDQEVSVAFDRGPVERGAPASSCTLPADFAITAPAERAELSRATQDLDVFYSGSGTNDQMRYELRGTCIRTVQGTVSGDLGLFKITKSELTSQNSDDATKRCDITLEMTRQRKGTLDSAYGKGGRIFCRQKRTRVFQSIP